MPLCQGRGGVPGLLVTRDGIKADPKKVEAVRDFPVPQNLRSLRSFLGLASYYRRFIPQFSRVAGPLFALTKKDSPFNWGAEQQEAFVSLKELLITAPVLAFPNFSKDYLLETDASGVGLGAVLAQRREDGAVTPIAYASRTLQKHEQNYGVTELEALGVVWAVKHFRHYLYGSRCDLFTDHQALKSLLNTPHPSGKLARWGLALQEMDLHIHYRPGKTNANADALSRFPHVAPGEGVVVAALMDVSAEGGDQTSTEAEDIKVRQRRDPSVAQMALYLETGYLPEEEQTARELVLSKELYELREGVLYRVQKDKTLRFIPPVEDRKKLFDGVHSGVFGGHLREAKIHDQLSRHYWWPRMRTDISAWCRSCLVCASRRVGKGMKPPLTPIPVAGPFDRVGVDVIQFPKSRQGNQYAVVFVDYLTKWPEVFAVQDQTAATIARLLVEQIVSRHGVPSNLLSDRGAAFLSKLMEEVNNLLGIHKVNTTAYHPQTDGLVERFNRTLTDMLAKTVEKSGADWDQRLPYVLFAYRSSLQQPTKESPFYLLYGRDPRLPTEEALCPSMDRYPMGVNDYRVQLVTSLSEAWELARSEVGKAQTKQKRQYDRHAVEVPFRKGDRVFVHNPGLKRGKAHKFARPFQGPFRITDIWETGADVMLIEQPKASTTRVSLNRLRRCPEEIHTLDQEEESEEVATLEEEECGREATSQLESAGSPEPLPPSSEGETNLQSGRGVWRGRLRDRKK